MLNPASSDLLLLKEFSRSKNAPIWKAVAEMIQRSRSRRAEVSLDKISRNTKDGSNVIVPGKVLGGNIDHKITLCALSISQNAAKKVIDAGGTILTIKAFIEKFPEGKGVIIIG